MAWAQQNLTIQPQLSLGPTLGVRLQEMPPVRRFNRRWGWGRVLAWLLIGASGLAAGRLWPGLAVMAALALLQLAALLRQPRWVQVDQQGVHLRYALRAVFLPWSSIQAVEGSALQTAQGMYTFPRSLQEGTTLIHVIEGVLKGESLLPPSTCPRPALAALEQWFGRPAYDGAVWLRAGLWSPAERGLCVTGLTLALFWVLLFALTDLRGLFWISFSLFSTTLALLAGSPLRRWARPYSISLDPEGIALTYLLRTHRLLWREISGLEGGRLHTCYGAIPLPLEESLRDRLAGLIDSLQIPRPGVVLPSPDGALRALALVSGPATRSRGCDLATSMRDEGNDHQRALAESSPPEHCRPPEE